MTNGARRRPSPTTCRPSQDGSFSVVVGPGCDAATGEALTEIDRRLTAAALLLSNALTLSDVELADAATGRPGAHRPGPPLAASRGKTGREQVAPARRDFSVPWRPTDEELCIVCTEPASATDDSGLAYCEGCA
jgi:hypothetical protein